jgi:hypothetical protein
VQHQQP